MWISSRLFFLLGIIVCLCDVVQAQSPTTSENKAALIFQIAEELEWPDTFQKDTFEIAIFDHELEMFSPLESLSVSRRIHNKHVLISIYTYENEIETPHLIYANKILSNDLSTLSSFIRNKSILLISDEATSIKHIQVDLSERENELSFKYNTSSIQLHQISQTENLEKIGGHTIDLLAVYTETLDALQAEQTRNKSLLAQIEDLASGMLKQTKKLGQNKLSLTDQTEKINRQYLDLAAQQDTLDDQYFRLEKLRVAIYEREDSLAKTSLALRNQKSNLRAQKRRAKRFDEKLKEKKKELALQESKIKEQKNVLFKKEEKIESQQSFIYFGAAVLTLFVGFIFVIWRSYRQKKAANALLQEKNFAISKKNREIQKQKEVIGRNHEHIQSSLRYATTIQQAILPSPKDMAVMSNFIIFKPKDLVSGDFYWMRTIVEDGQNVHFFAAVDCTGHGVPGAFMSMIANRILNEIINVKGIYNPEDILEELDASVKESLRQHENQNRDGMDLCLVKIYENNSNDDTCQICFAGGKRPLYIYDLSAKKITRIVGSRRGIAGSHVKHMFGPFESHNITLKRGDSIYLTSDGYPDQNNVARKRYGTKKLLALLTEIGNLPMQEQKRLLEESLAEHQSTAAQRDDITLMGIRL